MFAAVLHSGGVDSTTALAGAIKNHGAENVLAIGVDYGQRHKAAELEAARKITESLEVEQKVLDLSGMVGIGGLTDKTLVIPEKSYEELGEGVSPTYVPFRNGLLIAAAASIADGMAGADGHYAIVYGAHAEDAAGSAYPDCSDRFVRHMHDAVAIASYGRGRVHAPYLHALKSDIIKTGMRLKVPYELTWSCYEGREKHCGVCPTCRARKQAFADAGVTDPTDYEV